MDSGSVAVRRLKPLSSCKSKVWRYFGFPANDSGVIINKKEVYCRIYEQALSYSGNMTNLFYHLQANHENEYSEVAPKKRTTEDTPSCSNPSPLLLTPKQATIKSCFDSSRPYPCQSCRYQHCENAVIEFICKDLQPLSVIDSPAFLKLVGTLDPRFQPPSRSTVTRVLIPQKYKIVKEAVLASISKANYCSLTTDLWTGCHRKAYMTVTAHYITSEWEMRHHCLQKICSKVKEHVAFLI